MKKEDVIEQLCEICSDVGDDVFKSEIAHDCFCGGNPLCGLEDDFSFDKKIIKHIKACVEYCKGINPEAIPEMIKVLQGMNSGFDRAKNIGDPVAQRLGYHHRRIKNVLALAKLPND